MKQNDRRNATISAMCRLMAKGIEAGYSLANIMTFLNESSNSDVKQLIALHIELNHRDKLDAFEKECQKDSDWLRYTRPLRRNGKRVVVRYPGHYSEAKIYQDFDKAYNYLENADALTLEREIAEYESVLAKDDPYAWLHESDNDVAYETTVAIAKAKENRLNNLSKIAYNAVAKDVKYVTVVSFMQTMCKDNEERAYFLQEYAKAQWRDGHNY